MISSPATQPTEYPWDQQADEPNKWFDRFDRFYRPLGADRTVEQAYRDYLVAYGKPIEVKGKRRRPPRQWWAAVAAYSWKDRALAWDQDQRRIKQAQEDKEKEEWQARRRQLMLGFFAKITASVGNLSPADPKLSDVTAALRMILEQNRLEYGLPTEIAQRTDIVEIEWRETNDY